MKNGVIFQMQGISRSLKIEDDADRATVSMTVVGGQHSATSGALGVQDVRTLGISPMKLELLTGMSLKGTGWSWTLPI